ncbi:MAG: hypothetical protein IPN94_25430 [Sphingobacteriales bacterium]|nr:hypothetical protein [Sphingobacteriales bacterium]
MIDENKAEIDFPNDLLHEIENYTFNIPETGERSNYPTTSYHLWSSSTATAKGNCRPLFAPLCLFLHRLPKRNTTKRHISCSISLDADTQHIVKAVNMFMPI